MTYDALESSDYLGDPVELYEFSRGTLRWRFTSSDEEVTWSLRTWTPAVIRRQSIERTPELNRQSIRLEVPRDFPVADLYRIVPPSDAVHVTIYRTHLSDPDAEGIALWVGRVVNCEWGDDGSGAALMCEPVTTSMRRPGLRLLWQKQCPHVLYGSGCNLSRDSFKLTDAASGVSGVTVAVPGVDAQPDGHFAGGYLEWESAGGVFERRFIRAHAGAVLTLSVQPIGLAAGMTVNVYPGCDHTLATCRDKFDNLDNYGGVPFLPSKNPFSGTPIY